MAIIKSIPIEILLQSMRYEPDTGKLFWLERTPDMFNAPKMSSDVGARIWNTRRAGKEAFTCIDSGYRKGVVHNVRMTAHRVAYAIFHKEWPKGEIDHINGDGLDNRIVNLRDVFHAENSKNRKLYRSNKSGVHGVWFDDKSKKWIVRTVNNGDRVYVGRYLAFEDAVEAKKDAELKYGYHVNHGRLT